MTYTILFTLSSGTQLNRVFETSEEAQKFVAELMDRETRYVQWESETGGMYSDSRELWINTAQIATITVAKGFRP